MAGLAVGSSRSPMIQTGLPRISPWIISSLDRSQVTRTLRSPLLIARSLYGA